MNILDWYRKSRKVEELEIEEPKVYERANWVPVDFLGDTLAISLHTGTEPPTTQFENEARYNGYARQHIPRSKTNWCVENGMAWNLQDIVFPTCTNEETGVEIKYVAIGDQNNVFFTVAVDVWVGHGISIVIPAESLKIELT